MIDTCIQFTGYLSLLLAQVVIPPRGAWLLRDQRAQLLPEGAPPPPPYCHIMALGSHPDISQTQTKWTDAGLDRGWQAAFLHRVPVLVPQPEKSLQNSKRHRFYW